MTVDKLDAIQSAQGFKKSNYASKPDDEVMSGYNYFLKMREEDEEHKKYMQESSYVHRLVLKAQGGNWSAIQKLHSLDIGDLMSSDSISGRLHNATLEELLAAQDEFTNSNGTPNEKALTAAVMEELSNDPDNQDITQDEVAAWIAGVSGSFYGV